MGRGRQGMGGRRLTSTCHSGGNTHGMASYTVNKKAVAHAERLIDAHQYVLESDWGDSQPRADDENTFLKSHTWDEYAAVASRADRRRQRRDQGAVRLRLRRSPPCPSDGTHRLSVPGRGMEAQGHRARRARAPTAPRPRARVGARSSSATSAELSSAGSELALGDLAADERGSASSTTRRSGQSSLPMPRCSRCARSSSR